MKNFLLNNGTEIPCICFGPGMFTRGLKFESSLLGKARNWYKYRKHEQNYYKAICSAIDAGYRFIDYSTVYGREDLIKKAIESSGVARSEFILTTRIPNSNQFASTVKEAVYRSLERFGTDYIDLLMFHWPVTDKYIDTWKQMIELQSEGICKNLGVANCHQHHIESLLKETGVCPVIDQVEIHPLFTQKELISFCREHGIVCEAYTPLARLDDRLTRLPMMKEISIRYGKTVAQIILRWHIQNGIIPVFRSLNAERQIANMDIFDFELSHDDMKKIDSVNINSRLRYDPDNCDFTIL